jgi:hypothetical protein
MKTNDEGIKKWLEETGVDWRFIREENQRKRVAGMASPFVVTGRHLKPVVDATRKAGLI